MTLMVAVERTLHIPALCQGKQNLFWNLDILLYFHNTVEFVSLRGKAKFLVLSSIYNPDNLSSAHLFNSG